MLLRLLYELAQRMAAAPNSKRKKLPLLLRIRQLLGVLLRALRLMLLLLVKLHNGFLCSSCWPNHWFNSCNSRKY